MRALHIVVCAVLSASSASAQQDIRNSPNLTKAEEGRVAIAQCYVGCMDRASYWVAQYDAAVNRLVDLRFGVGGFRTLTNAHRSQLETAEELQVCLVLQNALRVTDACRAGCVDLETVYGVSSALARNRFRQVLSNNELQNLSSGLWVDYQNSPDPNSEEFAAACDAYFSPPSSASDGSNILRRAAARPAASKPND